MEQNKWNLVAGSNRQYSNRRAINANDKKIIVVEDYTSNYDEAEANAALIVSSVNALKEINPANPLKVAEVLPDMVKAFDDLLFLAGIHEADNPITDEWYFKIEAAREIRKTLHS